MGSIAYRVVSLQLMIGILSAILGYMFFDADVAKSAFYGGAVASINGLQSLRRIRRAEQVVAAMPSQALFVIYGGAAARFLLTLVLFGIAFGFLHLKVLPALIVFGVAQLAYGWGLRQSYKDLL